MKISIDIDCTPQEARRFLGLPDVEPLQQAMIAHMQEQMDDVLAGLSPDALMKLWMPGGTAAWDGLQKAFWASAAQSGKSEDKDKT
jgi:hypothetical protein